MQNWIKCSEQTPDDYLDVNFYSQSKGPCVGYRFAWTDMNKFYTSHGEYGGLCNDATHWQPLPESP